MDDMGIQILIGKLVVSGQHPRSASPPARPRLRIAHVHHTSVLDSPAHLFLSTNSQRHSLLSAYCPPPRR